MTVDPTILNTGPTILVTGSREWTDRFTIFSALRQYPTCRLLIHGNARGADRIAAEIAEHLGFKIKSVPAQWDRYNKAAGAIRNRVMLDLNPDLVLAFHSNLAVSKGTKDCVEEAQRRKIPVRLIRGIKDL